MSTSTSKNPPASSSSSSSSSSSPAGGEQVVYVKLPPPGTAHAALRPRNAPNPLWQKALNVFAFALCCTLPISSGLIMVLLAIHSVQVGFSLLWLWIPMFLFVEPIAFLVAYGIWREYSGWRVRRDYLR